MDCSSNVLTDLAVGVAGQVLQHGAAQRLLVQARQRQDRQDLADGPGVRQALEYREVADVLVGQLVVELVEHRAVRALTRLELVVQATADGEVTLLGQRLLRQAELAGGSTARPLPRCSGWRASRSRRPFPGRCLQQFDQHLQHFRLLDARHRSPASCRCAARRR